ncbi:hypothetical protein PproGo58_47370 [Pseudomonas protegens]|nr:hypothetical protein PproGo58_47370 [Pseudomonas protegens]
MRNQAAQPDHIRFGHLVRCGPYCVLSQKRAKGFKVRRLEQGFTDWQAAGLGVETSE